MPRTMKCCVISWFSVLVLCLFAELSEAALDLECSKHCNYGYNSSTIHNKPYLCNCRVIRTPEVKEAVNNQRKKRETSEDEEENEEPESGFPFLKRPNLFKLKSRSYEPNHLNIFDGSSKGELLEKLREKLDDLKNARLSKESILGQINDYKTNGVGLLPAFPGYAGPTFKPFEGFFNKQEDSRIQRFFQTTPKMRFDFQQTFNPILVQPDALQRGQILEKLRTHVDGFMDRFDKPPLQPFVPLSQRFAVTNQEKLMDFSPPIGHRWERFSFKKPTMLGASKPDSSTEEEEDEQNSTTKESTTTRTLLDKSVEDLVEEDMKMDDSTLLKKVLNNEFENQTGKILVNKVKKAIDFKDTFSDGQNSLIGVEKNESVDGTKEEEDGDDKMKVLVGTREEEDGDDKMKTLVDTTEAENSGNKTAFLVGASEEEDDKKKALDDLKQDEKFLLGLTNSEDSLKSRKEAVTDDVAVLKSVGNLKELMTDEPFVNEEYLHGNFSLPIKEPTTLLGEILKTNEDLETIKSKKLMTNDQNNNTDVKLLEDSKKLKSREANNDDDLLKTIEDAKNITNAPNNDDGLFKSSEEPQQIITNRPINDDVLLKSTELKKLMTNDDDLLKSMKEPEKLKNIKLNGDGGLKSTKHPLELKINNDETMKNDKESSMLIDDQWMANEQIDTKVTGNLKKIEDASLANQKENFEKRKLTKNFADNKTVNNGRAVLNEDVLKSSNDSVNDKLISTGEIPSINDEKSVLKDESSEKKVDDEETLKMPNEGIVFGTETKTTNQLPSGSMKDILQSEVSTEAVETNQNTNFFEDENYQSTSNTEIEATKASESSVDEVEMKNPKIISGKMSLFRGTIDDPNI